MAETVKPKPFLSIAPSPEGETPEPIAKPVMQDISNVQDNVELVLDPRLSKALSKGAEGVGFSVPQYKTVKRGKLSVSVAVIDGEDYYYQLEAPAFKMDDRSVIGLLVQTMSEIVPDHVDVFIQPPPKALEMPLWTVAIKKGNRLPGADRYLGGELVDRLLGLESVLTR